VIPGLDGGKDAPAGRAALVVELDADELLVVVEQLLVEAGALRAAAAAAACAREGEGKWVSEGRRR